MPRSVNAVASRKRRKRILKKAKGFWGRRGTLITVAKHSVEKAGQHAYRDRKKEKKLCTVNCGMSGLMLPPD